MASCFEGIGAPLRVAGWKRQFSSAARHLSVDVGSEALQHVLLTISPRSSMVISMTSLPGVVGQLPRLDHGIGSRDRQCRTNFFAVELAAIERSVGKSRLHAVTEGRECLSLGVVFFLWCGRAGSAAQSASASSTGVFQVSFCWPSADDGIAQSRCRTNCVCCRQATCWASKAG